MRLTACLVANPVMVNNSPLMLCRRRVGPQTHESSILNTFNQVGWRLILCLWSSPWGFNWWFPFALVCLWWYCSFLSVFDFYSLVHDGLIRDFTVRMKKAWVHSYPLSAQRRLWSDTDTLLVLSWSGSYTWCRPYCFWSFPVWCPGLEYGIRLGRVTRKTVFGVCEQVRLKLVCSATETS